MRCCSMESVQRSRIRRLLEFRFPTAFAASAPPLSHADILDLYEHLPLHQAKDVIELLPRVLDHLAETEASEEFSDLVVYFLDVDAAERSSATSGWEEIVA